MNNLIRYNSHEIDIYLNYLIPKQLTREIIWIIGRNLVNSTTQGIHRKNEMKRDFINYQHIRYSISNHFVLFFDYSPSYGVNILNFVWSELRVKLTRFA
jgi:hypothetical protein